LGARDDPAQFLRQLDMKRRVETGEQTLFPRLFPDPFHARRRMSQERRAVAHRQIDELAPFHVPKPRTKRPLRIDRLSPRRVPSRAGTDAAGKGVSSSLVELRQVFHGEIRERCHGSLLKGWPGLEALRKAR